MITTKFVFTTPSLAMFLMVLAAVSCDTLNEDEISADKQLTFGQTHFYAVRGSPLLIDAALFIEESFVNATLMVSAQPSKGALSQVDDILLRYQPGTDFLEGVDEFSISVWVDGHNRHTETVSIMMKSGADKLPCGLYAIGDKVLVIAGLSAPVIRVLENDALCGAGSSALQVSIYSAPEHGTASVVGNVITYTPGPTFVDKDELIYKLSEVSEDSASYATVLISECVVTAVSDVISIKDRGPSVNILRNDVLCGIRKNLSVSISSAAQFGTASLVGDSVIVYNPGPNFDGYDQLTYQLAVGSGPVTYGTVLIMSDWVIEEYGVPDNVSEVFFLDEMTGYVAGDGIYKTTDGGKTWTEQALPTEGQINDLQFLNKEFGYATYSNCLQWGVPDCLKSSSGLFKTSDGGQHWDLIDDFNAGTFSVSFTSAMTGYVGVVTNPDELEQWSIISKTEDGGEHWKIVFSMKTLDLPRVEFVSPTIGYLWGLRTIYITEDAGDSWRDSTPEDVITSLAVTKNFAFLTVSPTGQGLASSSIIRSTHGGVWQSVIDFPYNSGKLVFSPSGNLGVTVGVSDPNFSWENSATQSITITRTNDQGQTWTMEPDKPLGYPYAITVPSDRVAYILCYNKKLIKYSIQ